MAEGAGGADHRQRKYGGDCHDAHAPFGGRDIVVEVLFLARELGVARMIWVRLKAAGIGCRMAGRLGFVLIAKAVGGAIKRRFRRRWLRGRRSQRGRWGGPVDRCLLYTSPSPRDR